MKDAEGIDIIEETDDRKALDRENEGRYFLDHRYFCN